MWQRTSIPTALKTGRTVGKRRLTALDQYDRLEALAQWQETADAPPREVVISFGRSRLTLTGLDDRLVGQWSLAALSEAPGKGEAIILTPDGAPRERLTLSEPQMIEAIQTVQGLRQHDGQSERRARARWRAVALGVAGLALVLVAIAPRLSTVLASQVPEPVWDTLARLQLAQALETNALTVCATPQDPSLTAVAERLGLTSGIGPPPLVMVQADALLVWDVLVLPNGQMLLSHRLADHPYGPDVLGGAVLRAHRTVADLRTATAEAVDRSVLAWFLGGAPGLEDARAALRVSQMQATPPITPAFGQAAAAAELSLTPYAAYLLDVRGDDIAASGVAELAGPYATRDVLPDQQWVGLQSRCS